MPEPIAALLASLRDTFLAGRFPWVCAGAPTHGYVLLSLREIQTGFPMGTFQTGTLPEIRIDDDQDCVWLRVEVAGSGASCHVGYRSCFYRTVPFGPDVGQALCFVETKKTFDPLVVYGDAPNPTRL